MKLDLGSFAFGSSVTSGGNTPSWGTSLGQIKPDLRLTYPGYDNIVIGMVNKSIPVDKVFIPLGKGGHICNSLEDDGILLASLFDKVYINEVRVNASFVMLIYREDSDSWAGRKTLKYNIKIEYRRGKNDVIYNSDFVRAAKEALQLADDACWLISDIFIINQDELHMVAGIVNPNKSESYPTAELRKAAFLEAIDTTYEENPHFKKKYFNGNINDLLPSQDSLDYPLQQIYYGAPGTGKSHEIDRMTEDKEVIRTTFHPDSDYSTFVGCYKPTMKVNVISKNGVETKEEQIVYRFVPQAFTKAYTAAWNTEDDVYLIIEEINRGNCAQIFGDLFQLLDRKDGVSEYPVDADSDLADYIRKELKDSQRDFPEGVKDGKKLVLPSNLYIWATMNTSDQSLFPIDSAFKRRWDWKYMKIKDEHKEWKVDIDIKSKDAEGNETSKKLDWWTFVDKINKIIASMTSSADKQLGYFFCKATKKTNDSDAEPTIITKDTFVSKVIFYLWNDVFKDYGFEDASLFRYKEVNPDTNKEEEKDLTFPDFYDEAGEEVNTKRLTDFVDKVLNWQQTKEE